MYLQKPSMCGACGRFDGQGCNLNLSIEYIAIGILLLIYKAMLILFGRALNSASPPPSGPK